MAQYFSRIGSLVMLTCIVCSVVSVKAEDDVAKQLANPVASLISVPIQANYDENFGPREKGEVWRINIQPVIPFSLNEDWNVISRTIVPVINQEDIPFEGDDEFGLGDTLQSLFFSPKAPTERGLIWGVGPAILFPTATEDELGGEKWGIGPTFVGLRQKGTNTFGLLVNHIESFAGDSDRDDISASFMQPFWSYITQTKTTFSINTESTYDWEEDEWSVPLNATAFQLLKVGNQLIQVGGGVRYWADSPSNGPEDWGLRIQLTLIYPK